MVFAKIAAWQKPHEVSNQLAQVLAGVFPNPMAPSSDTLEALFPHLAHNQKQNKQNTFPRRLLTDKSYSKITMQGRNSHSTMPHTLWSSNHKRNFPFIRLHWPLFSFLRQKCDFLWFYWLSPFTWLCTTSQLSISFWRQNKSEGETDEKVCQSLDWESPHLLNL